MGSLLAGPLMDKFGRKKICMATCLPIILSWTLLKFTSSVSMIYWARIIAGLAAGLTTVSLVYVMEISHPRVRGMLLCFNSVFVSLGILLTCLFALFFNWREMTVIFIIFNIIVFCGLFFIPESPHWLVYFDSERHNNAQRMARADRSLKWLNPRQTVSENICKPLLVCCLLLR